MSRVTAIGILHYCYITAIGNSAAFHNYSSMMDKWERMLYCTYLSSPRRFADGTIITLKCLDFFKLSRCSNYNIVPTMILWSMKEFLVFSEGDLVLINLIWINFHVVNALICYPAQFGSKIFYFTTYSYLCCKPVIIIDMH